MTEAGDPAIQALIAAARSEFAENLIAKATEIETLVGRAAWDEARRAAHKLRGSAGVYGFAELGAAAAALDDLLSGAKGAPPTGRARACLGELVADLRAEAELALREPR